MSISTYSDADSERGVLGTILFEPERAFQWLQARKFSADMFELRPHRILFNTMLAMQKTGKCIDILTVTKRLEDKHNFEEAGGRVYLNKCLDNAVALSYFEGYVETVIEKHRLRCLRDCYIDMQQEMEGGSTSQELISSLMSNLSSHIDLPEGANPVDIHARSLKEAEDAQMQGKPAGIPSFLPTLSDTMGNYLYSMMYVIAGKPSNGKSTVAFAEALHSSIILRIPTAFVSMEMGEQLLREQMAGCIANVSSFAYRRGLYSPPQRARMIQAFDLLSKAPLFINDERMTIDQTVAWLSNMVSKHGVRLVILDYIQLIKASKGTGNLGRTEQVMNWSGELKAFAKKSGVSLLVLSQLSRFGIRLEGTTPPAPTLESLKDTSAIEQDADVVLFVFKKPGEPSGNFFSDNDWPMELSISKNRIGPTGRMPLLFVRSRQRFVVGPGEENDWTRVMRPEITQGELQ